MTGGRECGKLAGALGKSEIDCLLKDRVSIETKDKEAKEPQPAPGKAVSVFVYLDLNN